MKRVLIFAALFLCQLSPLALARPVEEMHPLLVVSAHPQAQRLVLAGGEI